ncbi:MAG: hypothetical protein AVDCRST_MAG18-1508 [uncultured Thermomicrobiales bacterium]|uniref:YdhG-like domain-containing protein n=1 Tax=uncultured Thermomicrobiales bacterium TaxID=1645740 RepID=A0A6J4V767_9BACT|nr:MAG: hypothetical protein AVDCRST_MAG18-1508 [uncultured Thermomicrobiales bacterium]
MPNRTDAVDQFMQTLDHPLKAEIEQVRGIILDADEQITEQIKWKAPSFCYHGDDRVTMRLHPQNRLQLVFHRGVKVKDSTDFVFEDSTGLLQWVAKDRAVVTIDDVEAQRAALITVVNRWMEATK